MPPTTTTDVAPPIDEYYDRALLVRARPFLVHDMFGQRRPLRQGYGNTVRFRRYNALDNTPVPLNEGVPPTGKTLSATDVTCEVDWYGDYVALTDKLLLTTVDPILLETTRLLGEQAGQILDQVIRNGMLAGTAFYRLSDDLGNYSDSAARNTVKGRVNKVVLDKIVRDFNNLMARPFTSMIRAGTGQGTRSVKPAFWGIADPYLEHDLENFVDGFQPVNDYASQSQTYANEIGATGAIRWIRTNMGRVYTDAGAAAPAGIKSTTGTSADVHAALIIAQDAYGIVPLDGMSLKHYAKQLGSAGALDPINQLASSGWKAAMTSQILNDDWIARLECAVTA